MSRAITSKWYPGKKGKTSSPSLLIMRGRGTHARKHAARKEGELGFLDARGGGNIDSADLLEEEES